MNLIILQEEERISDSLFKLENRKAIHILKVLKAKLGDSFKAGLLNHSFGNLFIKEINSFEIICEYVETNWVKESNLSTIHIFSSYQRPQTSKKIIQLVANLGIKNVFFFELNKTEKSYIQSSLWKQEELLHEIILGLEQGKRIQIPQIQFLKNKFSIKDFAKSKTKIVLELNQPFLNSIPFSAFQDSIDVILGPESGLEKNDLDYFQSIGFESFSISESTLRSEIALTYFLSQIELLRKNI